MEPELPALPTDADGNNLGWHALNYRTAHTVHAQALFVELERYVRSYGLRCYQMGVERAKMYRLERDAARVQKDHVLKVLTGIHALLPPGPIAVDGKTYIFNDPDANRTLWALKERIDAIEAEAAAAIRKGG